MSVDNSIKQKLESVGLAVAPYKRSPVGRDNFAISLDRGSLRIWQGKADVTVRTNKQKKQALVNVIERPGVITSKASFTFYGERPEPKTLDAALGLVSKHYGSKTATTIINFSNVTVPNSTMKIIEFKVPQISPLRVEFQVEFRTRTTRTSFLVGYEGGSQYPFICQLKSFVDSFEEAYTDLHGHSA
jgi:hypothetical protein